MSDPFGAGGGAPQPLGIGDVSELAIRLGELRRWSGLSYRELHRRVVAHRRAAGVVEEPTFNTVWRCLQPGRARLDPALVADIVRALTGDESAVAMWRLAGAAVAQRRGDADVVETGTVLPPAEPAFVGRDAQLRAVAQAHRGTGPTVVLIDGMAGAGKTWLAVQAARLTWRPGAGPVLTVDLRGYEMDRRPANPHAVLGEFLTHLGVAPELVAGLGAAQRVERYRQLVRERPALVLIDNAVDEAQVRPLLPQASGSLALVTSRRRLAGLRGRRIRLGGFTPDESCAALRTAVAPAYPDADEPALRDLAAAVAHLPLAVALVGRQVCRRPDWALADHTDRLTAGAAAGRLDEQVERALAASYQALPIAQRALARALALHPGRIDEHAAAALAGVGVPAAGAGLIELSRANLLTRSSGRYALHDLVRLYLTVRSWDEDPPAARRGAWIRLVRSCR